MVASIRLPNGPDAVRQALESGGVLIAGGTHLMAELNNRASADTHLISLRRAGLAGISVDAGVATMGATTTLASVACDERLAFLSGCVRSIASPPVRNLATIAGNLFVPQPYGDLAAALLALAAEVDIASPDGERTEPVENVLTAGIPASSFVARVRFRVPGTNEFRFHKASRRRINAPAVVTVAAHLKLSDGVVSDVRIALGGVAPTPVRSVGAECALLGGPVDRTSIARAAEAALADIAPFDDAHASAWYRTRVVPVHLRRALLGG